MKAVILAAGKGSRINHLTDGKPKSLLPFCGTTVLGHSLEQLKKADIDSIVLVTGYQRQAIIDHVQSVWRGAVEIVYNPMFERTNVLYSFWLALPWARNDDIIFLHADTVFSQQVLERLLAEDHPVVLAVDRRPCDDEAMKVRLDGDRVMLVTKEMPSESADGEFLGLAKIQNGILKMLRRRAESLFEEGDFNAFFERAVQESIDKEDLIVRMCDVSGLPWREIDFEEDYLAALDLFSQPEPEAF